MLPFVVVAFCDLTVVGCWCGYVSGSRRRFAYGPADATASLSLAAVNPDWFTFLILPLWSRTKSESAVKWLCMCVFVVEGSANTSSDGVADGSYGVASDAVADVWHNTA